VTLFGHRRAKHDAWDILSRVVDLNLETLPFEMDTTQVQQVFALCATIARWMHEASVAQSGEGGVASLLPHQIERAPVSPTRKPDAGLHEDITEEAHDDNAGNVSNTFALQITVRFTAHVLLRVRSERRGDLQVAVIAQHAALNWIQQDDKNGSTEVQLTVHDLSMRHKEKVLFHIKPAREVLQLKRLPGPSRAVFIKWHLQKLTCRLEKEIALVANELFHSLNEIEQAATITCGSCHHKIRLDTVATHVCNAAASLSSNSSRHSSGGVSIATERDKPGLLDSTRIPKLRIVFALDELELVTDSFLFRSVQDLARLRSSAEVAEPSWRYVVTLKDWSVSTESREFVGDAIFVPVLPLAFQMLECTIRGCGCVQRQQQRQRQRAKKGARDAGEACDHQVPNEMESTCPRALPRWPDRVFAELGHLSVRTTDTTTKSETFLSADSASLRLSFSDGRHICPHSTPQMSYFFHVERIRCQMEHTMYQHVRRIVAQLQDPLEGYKITALTLFFGVLEIRTVELTLLREATVPGDRNARFKAQFRHVGGVADNHQGHLSLQTNFDFRALLQSEVVRFGFAPDRLHESETAGEGASGLVHSMTKRERRRQRDTALRIRSAQRIQCVFRRFVVKRRKQVDEELRRLTREDTVRSYSPEGAPETLSGEQQETEPANSSSPLLKPGSRPPLFGSTEDLAAISPMKMVAAASTLKDGVLGFVKAKQLRLETEMTEFALQSKESASRFIPKYSAVKNLLSPKTASEASSSPSASFATAVAMAQEEPTGKDSEVRDVETENEMQQDGSGYDGDDGRDGSKEDSATETQHESRDEDQENDDDAAEQDKASEADLEEKDRAEEGVASDEDQEAPLEAVIEEAVPPPPLSATETLLASLPAIVRLMVQVEERRLCVPIDPRAHVAVLCREIVRRFNEMFAPSGGGGGGIVHVTLQNPQGGVFAGSDIVGLVWDTTAKTGLLFAYPHDPEAGGKSVVHFDPSSYGSSSPSSGKTTRATAACAFTRCSKLPLPLVVALLANESERDLLSHIVHDSGDGGASDWPELALNASFLDPRRHMLQVEVRWPGETTRSVVVTNRDAFLLCLQQLGLCTSRDNSKHVGKVLRDRLKMDPKNPLIRAACEASPEFQKTGLSDADATDVSYASLKEIVQEDFGVYTRTKE
jgi:hypothetical protein